MLNATRQVSKFRDAPLCRTRKGIPHRLPFSAQCCCNSRASWRKNQRWTSSIAAAIAKDDYNLYRFEGLKPRDNLDLHITSSRFDEPQCLALISNCDFIVAVHGCAGEERAVYLGGIDCALKDAIYESFKTAGFVAGVHTNPDLQGMHPSNICNRGRRDCGVQLELTYGLRSALMAVASTKGVPTLAEFVAAVRGTIEANH